ncbi:ATP-grasp domain-containing protein [Kordiimonas lacus]|uniref:ATP-grasp domain-containing protein n=1 Tax=Kordiimonas lacus TaxID=637679 RepID=UPI0009E9F513|nr:ATP-grasp domain-containing protein [Kordiimonas lacus]
MVECILTKRLLVLGGGRQAVRGLEQLKSMGLELVVCDMDPSAPGFSVADHRIQASVYHLDDCLPAVKRFHAKLPLDGVMCLACDVPHIVARIAEVLGTPHIPVSAADLTVDKLAMKARFEEYGVKVPPYARVANPEALENLAEEWGHVVVKPVDSRGSKGVSLLERGGDGVWAFEHALSASPSGRVMAEKFLEGPQVSSESVIIAGQAITPALSDRNYEFLEKYAPFLVENGGDMPSKAKQGEKDAIWTLIGDAARSLGIENGVLKGDIVLHGGEPYIIEVAARLSGGYFCTHQIPFSTDVYLVEACARLALGMQLDPADYQAKADRHVCSRWLIPGAGQVVSLGSRDKILSLEGVLAFECWVEQGDMVAEAENAAASVAMVQATGVSREEAISCANQAFTVFGLVTKR